MSFDVIASGDHHFEEGARFDECKRVHKWIAQKVATEKPKVFCSAGDIYDAESTPMERAAVAEWLIEIAETCPILLCRGNHDRDRDLEILAKLRARHPIIVEEGARVHTIGNLAIAALAWPSTAMLAKAMGGVAKQEAKDAFAREQLQSVLRGLGAELAEHDGPRILLTHAMIDGARTSVGQPLIGAQMNVGLEDLALARADIVIAGHIHCQQEWTFGGTPMLYTGSPYRTAYGEVEEKSILGVRLYDNTMGRKVYTERLATPATAMFLAEDEWGPNAQGVDEFLVGCHGLGEPRGAEIRFRYSVDSDKRDAARAAANAVRDTLLAEGATSVKIEERVLTTSRARTPEITTAESIEQKLEVLWTAKGTTPDNDRKEKIFAKVHELEGEAA